MAENDLKVIVKAKELAVLFMSFQMGASDGAHPSKRSVAMYRRCPWCGAYLDSGEICDCKKKPPRMWKIRKRR